MAYVLGYLYADGNMEYSPSIRAKYVRFFTTDKDRVLLIRELMGSEHVLYIRKKTLNRKEGYSLHIGSHTLFDALIKIGVTPNKTFTASFPDVPSENLAAFTLGYFDGDGCAFLERSASGNPRCLHSIFTSGSKNFLVSLHVKLVETIGIVKNGPCKHGSSKNAYQLRYATRDSIRLFMFMYATEELKALALRRKYAIFTKYFEERNLGPDDLYSVLKQKGPVANEERIGLQTQHERVRLPPGPQ